MEHDFDNKDTLNNGLKSLGLELDQQVINRIIIYFDYLRERNSHFNLISSKQDLKTQIVVHLVDSLGLLIWSKLPQQANALDLGSGGGLPAIPLALAKPDWRYTLAEATGKKTSFLTEVKNEMQISNIFIQNTYLEFNKNTDQIFYDLITARGVSALNKLIGLAAPRMSKNGLFIAYKGPQAGQEIFEAKNNIDKYKLKLRHVIEFTLPITYAHRKILIFGF